ncbi:hypothetical protein GCM10027059_42360 [Myceligenerans halotolerans]
MGQTDMSGRTAREKLRATVLVLALLAAAAIAALSLENIWVLARPAEVGTACVLTDPAPPGCSPDSRFTPAFASAIVISISYATVTLLLLRASQRRGIVAASGLGGLALLGILTDQFVRWGGLPG